MSDVLAELERELSVLPPATLTQVDTQLADELAKPWLPQPGPQTQALHSEADLLLYGGAAGGGKSDLLLGTALSGHARAVIFRAQYGDLAYLEERLLDIVGTRDGYNGADMVLRLPHAMIEFGALGRIGAEKSWQGRPHDFIGFDEGAQLSAAKVRYVLGWNRSTAGKRCRGIIASNPPDHGEGDWLIEWFAPWLDPMSADPALPGELRWCVTSSDFRTVWVAGPGDHLVADEKEPLAAESRTFIPARLDDNAYLRDTGYRAKVMALPEPRRSQLLHGDFLAARQDHEWQVIPAAWVKAAQERWSKGKPADARMVALGVDIAQGGPDMTVVSALHGAWFDELRCHKGVDTRNGPAVAALVIRERRDGAAVNIDLTGGWGGSARDHLEGNGVPCSGIVFSGASHARTKDGKFRFLNKRAELWWLFREALDPESGNDIALPPDKALAAELACPRWELRGDRVKVEMKEDIRARLGASTDRADAVILAWHDRRAVAVARHRRKARRGTWLGA